MSLPLCNSLHTDRPRQRPPAPFSTIPILTLALLRLILKQPNDKNLSKPLRSILNEQEKEKSKAGFLSQCLKDSNIPKGNVNDPSASLVQKWEDSERRCSKILMDTLIKHHKSEMGALNNKFNNTTLTGVNTIINSMTSGNYCATLFSPFVLTGMVCCRLSAKVQHTASLLTTV